jgi:riboflavin kinase/FMN adenylyltransferase
MRIHTDINNLPELKNAVLTIGSFDGVHKGHKAIFRKLKQLANKLNGESVVVTFNPHPRSVIFPKDNTLKLLTTIDEKIEEFSRLDIDHLVIVPFTIEFSQLHPNEYVEKFLVNKFKPAHIVIGYDHRFGLNREGNVYVLHQFKEKFGFGVTEIPKQTVDEISVSSTKIRKALQVGQITKANELLGHFYPMSGTVVHGEKLGNQLGFPTANLALQDSKKLIPPQGIYAAFAEANGKNYQGMLYIGNKPTVSDSGQQSIEIHLFDFDGDLYDQKITIRFVQFLREDRKYDSLDELRHQLRVDQIESKKVFENDHTLSQTFQKGEKVAVVILNFNGLKYLQSYLPALLQYTDLNIADIYVADNASEQDELSTISAQFPDIKTIQLEKNYGFAEGYNRALEQIDASWFVLLNNDVKVSRNWLEPLLKVVSENENVVAAQPKIRSARDTAFFEYAGAAGGHMDSLGYPFCSGRIFETVEKDEGQYDEQKSIFWSSGAAMIIKADIFLRAGGFDEDFFAHQEEIDLCWRIRRAGYDIQYIPHSTVFHWGGGTLSYHSPNKVYLNFRNNLITLLKNEPVSRLIWLFPFRLILDGLAAIKFIVDKEYASIRSIVKAHGYIFRNWSKIMQKRQLTAARVRDIRSKKSKNSTISLVRFKGSIVIQYFLRKRKVFSKLATT